MSTPKRLAANRANAARSTGPRTPEGKARSAQNSRKHGFAAAQYSVVRLEDLDSLHRLRDDAIAAYQPQNSQELFAVERIALSQMSLLRCASLEAGLLTAALNETMDPFRGPDFLFNDEITRDTSVTVAQNDSHCLAKGFQRLLDKNDAWKLFLRYQAQSERLYRRAVEEFERLRALRDELPNEPIADPVTPPPDPATVIPPSRPLTGQEKAEREYARIDPTFAPLITARANPLKDLPNHLTRSQKCGDTAGQL